MKGFFIKTHSIQSRCVIGPENILFAGACVHFSALGILRSGSVKGLTGNRVETPETGVANFRYAIRIIITAGCIQTGSSCGSVLWSEVCGAQ